MSCKIAAAIVLDVSHRFPPIVPGYYLLLWFGRQNAIGSFLGDQPGIAIVLFTNTDLLSLPWRFAFLFYSVSKNLY
ncbi:MAG: hypothetical protein WB502_09855 [Thermoactinomyces sp.]